ncbi:MAG: hypothetical protein A2469_03005 [Candidatus Magasanikbacteria bacterium RIFOXYC2_FULL_40_16]|uniref:SIMPL domain-containing protein n=2 Tax=Candidatus Magasanikiibacteriota TaxID=1752731 RepID=A0A1F6P201_9BACT|nr:MAG: hypothetical protein A2301_00260 [Candidatus Magasanikbacteria bacterium RIFOXYB2_FULL_40_13]OGH87888.1 MAG: hypothetical protein A2206_00295 [Candidatus Magasanikbacteria bacterium RIFOXYA1_FULL_40_8]OGH89974.1 MAG: hypothetical protein A2469_03005 [Candidatus Magasanikbacteria bacterium RIFOXYC2_FULL_40_16]
MQEAQNSKNNSYFPKGPSCGGMIKKILFIFITLAVVYFIVLLATMIRNNLKEYYYIGKADRQERTISLDAVGKVNAKTDIAVTTMGMISEAETVAEAQKKNTEVMNNLIGKLKALNIEEKDIQTNNYNIYPRYDYLPDEGSILRGYTVSQNVTVKIRDLEKADDVIALAGEVGANNVSGLSFTIDEMDAYLDEARKDALEKIGEKVGILKESLGVKFVSVVSYSEYSGNSYPGPLYDARAMEYGMGGGAATPSIEAGSEDVTLNVNIIFEIK